MGDLSSTCGCSTGKNNGGCNWIWIILLLSCCGNGCMSGCGSFGGRDNNCGNSCEWLIWILLLSCFCGNGGNTNNCGCC